MIIAASAQTALPTALDREAWQARVHRIARVSHDLVTKATTPLQSRPDLSGGFVLFRKAGPPQGAQNCTAEMPVQLMSPVSRAFPLAEHPKRQARLLPSSWIYPQVRGLFGWKTNAKQGFTGVVRRILGELRNSHRTRLSEFRVFGIQTNTGQFKLQESFHFFFF